MLVLSEIKIRGWLAQNVYQIHSARGQSTASKSTKKYRLDFLFLHLLLLLLSQPTSSFSFSTNVSPFPTAVLCWTSLPLGYVLPQICLLFCLHSFLRLRQHRNRWARFNPFQRWPYEQFSLRSADGRMHPSTCATHTCELQLKFSMLL